MVWTESNQLVFILCGTVFYGTVAKIIFQVFNISTLYFLYLYRIVEPDTSILKMPNFPPIHDCAFYFLRRFQAHVNIRLKETMIRICLWSWGSHILPNSVGGLQHCLASGTIPYTLHTVQQCTHTNTTHTAHKHKMSHCHPTPSGFALALHGNICHGPESWHPSSL